LIGRMGGALGVPEEGVAVSWRRRAKPQPPNVKFTIPADDAPNVAGALDLGFPVKRAASGEPDLGAFRKHVEDGQIKVLYVFDPGPEGSIGDVSWIIGARTSGKLPHLIVQGVLLTDLAKAADIVLPGAAWVEKDASYVNQQGHLQGTARAIAPPGEAMEDWQIFVNVGVALGAPLTYASSQEVRADIAAALPNNERYASLTSLAFGRPVAARTWLQASNPSERWKWDFMFQDLPPVKFEGRPGIPVSMTGIRLTEVK
jgi:anaerobic selenocysteine-containing dehydrogenase